MNSKIYKQTDSRWASKPYPKKGSSFGGNGCGCCACVHIAIEQEAKKNWTPESLRPWMIKQGFAIYGQGTTWSGITATLKHIGHKNVVCVWNDPMSVAWKELNKGNRIGIILFSSGTGPNGTRWTAGGHYVAFTDYKIKDGKHYFYCKDSGGRNHDGWYTYENSMKGCVAKVWIVERLDQQVQPPKKPTGKYTGTIPSPTLRKGSSGAQVKYLQQFLNWYLGIKLAIDGSFGNATASAVESFQAVEGITIDGIYGGDSYKKAKAYYEAKKKADVEPQSSSNTNTNTTPAPKPSATPKKGIDVSEWQGKIDWAKVKKDGINYVIIRAGYGNGHIDTYWKRNIEGAIKAGIQYIGAYWFSYAYTNSMAKNEADYLISAVAPYKEHINMPLFYDFEYDSAKEAKAHKKTVNRSFVTGLHKAFCARIKEKGYKVGYYYNYDYKTRYISISELPYYEWYALYDTSDKQTNTYAQQYSSKGRVSGISGNVDMNYFFFSEPGTKKSTKLAVDGKMGPQTNKAIQKWVGVTQDGIIGPKTIKALQKKLGVTQDGKWGPNTTKALQKFLNKSGYTLAADGTLGPATIKALQRYLNDNVLK